MDTRSKITRNVRSSRNVQKSRPNKRKQYFNPKTSETGDGNFSALKKKLKTQYDFIVPQDDSVQYRILNFITVFSAISTFVKCKVCNNNVKFQPSSTCGLCFKIVVSCGECMSQEIPSCSYVERSFEINRRFIFVMRVLGLGQAGAKKFCGLMDMPPFLYNSTYNLIIKYIHSSAQTVRDVLFKKSR